MSTTAAPGTCLLHGPFVGTFCPACSTSATLLEGLGETGTQRDGDTMAAWLREAADELDKAHAVLDDLNVPRSLLASGPIECSLAARIQLLAGRTGE